MKQLKLNDLQYEYYTGRPVLKGINAKFEPGKIYAISGESGGGKTTLLSLMGGLDEPTNGHITWGKEKLSAKRLLNYRKNIVAFIFQSYNLIDYLTAAENVRLTTKESPYPILEDVGITKMEATRSILQLSGGQQQRVAIARALASNAEIILADEPTGNLDEETAMGVVKLLQKSAHEMGKCVIVATHSKELAGQADVTFQLKHGVLKNREEKK